MDYSFLCCTSFIALCLNIALTKHDDVPSDIMVRANIIGTSIDVFPEAVHVVANDPEAAAKRLEEKGGSRTTSDSDGSIVVTHNRTTYHFGMPDTFNQINLDYNYALGDVIYVFHCDSTQEVQDFVDKYKLRKHCTITMTNNIERDLYIAESGYYVRFKILEKCYLCPFSCDVIEEEPGFCPDCGTQLIENNVYR